jgi:hypothetical protein
MYPTRRANSATPDGYSEYMNAHSLDRYISPRVDEGRGTIDQPSGLDIRPAAAGK